MIKLKQALSSAADSLRAAKRENGRAYFYMSAALVAVMLCEIVAEFTSYFIDTLDVVMLLSAVFFSGILLVKRKLFDNVQSALMAAFVIWMAVTRVILGDTGLTGSIPRLGYVAFASVIAFNAPRLLKKNARSLLLTVITLILGGFGFTMAFLSVIDTVFCLKSQPVFWRIFIWEDNRLQFFKMWPLISGVYLNLGICSALIRAAHSRHRAMKIVYLACVPVILLMLSLTNARASTAVAAACIGAAGGIWVFAKLRERTVPVPASLGRVLKPVCCIILGAALTFGVMRFVSGGVGVLADLGTKYREAHPEVMLIPDITDVQPDGTPSEDFAASAEAQSDETGSADGSAAEVTIWNRDYDEYSVKTLSGRTILFKYAINRFFHEPKTLALGNLYEHESYIVPLEDGGEMGFNHLHNAYLSTLSETGLAGFLLSAAFIFITLYQMARLYFGPFKKYGVVPRLLILPVASLLIIGMLEPILFNTYITPKLYLMHIIFALFSGFVYGEYKDPEI